METTNPKLSLTQALLFLKTLNLIEHNADVQLIKETYTKFIFLHTKTNDTIELDKEVDSVFL